ncbi:hypothetical protein IQ254_10460 [Nodosilinea sp. LEGE 07088]|uniref:hypothetical protein n=1 Tax=Nodosilinea sp. LEGE 07088 TaxID=2777968 RepID=UPI00187E740D|nr:hypothetical protein [Nodosilinea sp. LEGE 07088]MBE9137631.1 hypothetical protein [Nodosilinea sp. LEGE 07088]
MKPAWPSLPLSRWLQRRLKVLSLFIASVFLVTGLAVPAQGAWQPAAMAPTPDGLDLLLAQEPNTSANSVLYFTTPTFTVSVHPRSTAQFMNVYNRDTRQSEQLNAPVSFRGSLNNDGWVSYDSFGSRAGRNVIYRASANRNAFQARLEVIDAASNSVLISQNSTSIQAMNVPGENPGQGNLLNQTFVGFDTQNHSVRVFNDNGVTKMNVFNKVSGQTLVNGQPATAEADEIGPYECWVNYFGGQSFGGAAARYFIRVSGSGEALLEVIAANGGVLLTEPRVSSAPLVTNIPQADRPACFGDSGNVGSGSLAPYIAAVFGSDRELEQTRQVLGQGGRGVSGLSCVIDPRFESARQGRFINAAECNDRNDAGAVVNFLRGRGLNSRLVYRNFRYR